MSAPRVSVLTPLYKGERFITYAIESVLCQTYPNIELIIINDGSPDSSADIVHPYLRDARVRYIEQANAGVANARNTGIHHATGKYIAFLDQDDLWDATKLAKQVEFMEKYPAIALVHCNIGFIDAEGHRVATPAWAWVQETTGVCVNELILGNRIATLTALVRRSCIDETGLFRQDLAPADDWDLWLRLAIRYPFGFIAEPLGYYRLHGGNESRKFLDMQIAETSVIERFLSEHDRTSAISRGTIRHKLLSLYKQTAKLASRELRQAMARHYWLKALSIQPWGVDSYAGLAWNYLSPDSRRILKWYRHRLFSKDKSVS